MTFDQWLDEPNPIAPSRSRRECFSARVIADFKTGWDAALAAPTAPAVAAEPSDAATLAIKALEAAKNGLEWYRDARPMLTDGSDDEMDAQIDAAILALRQRQGTAK